MRIIYTVIFLFFCTLAFAQSDSSRIDKIRKTVQNINKDTTYTIKTLKSEEFIDPNQAPDGGGHLIGYFKNGQLVKIDEFIGLSSCLDITTYYLHDNKLIFVYTQGKEFQYVDSLATFNSNIQTVTMECRFYFDNGQMIQSILNGATRCGGQPLDSWAKTDQDKCTRYINLFKKKK